MSTTSRIVRQPECGRITGLSRSTIYRLERDGKFPARIRLSANAVGWREEDVLAWIASRPER